MPSSFYGDSDIQLVFKKINIGAGELPQQSAVLVEDLSSAPCTPMLGSSQLPVIQVPGILYVYQDSCVSSLSLPHTHNLKEKLSVKVKLKVYEIILLF